MEEGELHPLVQELQENVKKKKSRNESMSRFALQYEDMIMCFKGTVHPNKITQEKQKI